MNDKFDELAKATAKPVTRLGALKEFGAGLALLGAAVLELCLCADAASTSSATITQNFTGSSNLECPDGAFCVKSDATGVAGPNHFVEMVNNHYAIYLKNGGTQLLSSSADDFWVSTGVSLAPKEHALDPQMLYYPAVRRWLASALDVFNNNGINADQGRDLFFAISRSSDPTEGWNGFRIHLTSNHDGHALGLNGVGVYVRVSEFAAQNPWTGHDGPFTAHTFLVFPKADLLLSTPTLARMTALTIPAPNLISSAGGWPRPVVDMDNGGMPEAVLSITNQPVPTFGVFKRSDILGPITAPTLDTGNSPADKIIFGTSAYGISPPAPQPDSRIAPIDVGYPAHQSPVVMKNGEIWSVLNAVDDGSGRGTIHWLRMSAAANAIIEEGFIGDPELWLFYPSIAINGKGDVVIGCNGSGPNAGQFASSYAIVGQTRGGHTVFGIPLLLKLGTASFDQPTSEAPGSQVAQWGDYSTTTLDPEDPYTFWTIQQCATGKTTWSTQITALTIAH